MNVLASLGFDDLRLLNLFARKGKIFGSSCCRRCWLFLLRLCRLLCCGTFRGCFSFWGCVLRGLSFRSFLFGCFDFWSLLFSGWLLFTSLAWSFCFVWIWGIRFFGHMSPCSTLPAFASGLRITPTVLRGPLRVRAFVEV